MNDKLSEFKQLKDVIRDYQKKGYPEGVVVGDYTYGIANVEGADEEKAKLTIGKYCSISHDVTIMLGGNHRPDWNSTYPFNVFMQSFSYIEGHPATKGDIVIGNDVWIGSGAKIMSGVKIADGTVVGANALVTKDTEPYSIVGGVPAKLIKKRFTDDIIDKFMDMKWWDWPDEHVLEVIPLLQSNNINDLYSYYLNNIAKGKRKILPKTAIIIVSYNACYMMQQNIESIRNTLQKDEYHIYVVDNASTDGIEKWLKEQDDSCDDITVRFNTENAGFPKACNQGVELALLNGDTESDIFLLNNDTRLCKNSLYNLKEALYSSEDVGAAGSISNYAGNDQQAELQFSLPTAYVEWGDNNNIAADSSNCTKLWEERVRLSGFAMLIKREAWDRAGGMDEAFSPGYFEDDDLSMNLHLQGKKLLLCYNSFVYHAGSQSFSQMDNVNSLLDAHYNKFIEKYGFPIIEYAYPDKEQLGKIKYNDNDSFNFLEINSGLGANSRFIRSKYKNAKVYIIEPNDKIRGISADIPEIFISLDAFLDYSVKNNINIDVVYADGKALNELTDSEFERLSGICSKDCLILPNDEIDFSKLKLVIWDLDNTFWDGVLSEGQVIPIEENVSLVKKLTNCGIINSISSKNNEADVMEMLKKLDVSDYFVFNDINWENKGEQIKNKLEQMGLRAENTLFIDDEIRNLEEADYINEGIIASDPMIIPGLIRFADTLEEKDKAHTRLNNYKLLEKKRNEQKKYSSKEQFLYDSDIFIEIEDDCTGEIDRIADLVLRSNQLNYTKIRDTKDDLNKLINDKYIEKGYIKAKDKFGDYGVIGFYCFDKDGNLRHFLFSCRVIGMGIEQKVYKLLGCPEINIMQPVAVELNTSDDCGWIRTSLDDTLYGSGDDASNDNGIKILLKGPCDLAAIASYLKGGNITTEFNYVNDMGFVTTGQNHSMHICESTYLTAADIDNISQTAPFITYGDFETSIFDKEYDVICLSLLPDCEAGYYSNKKSGHKIAFGSLNFDVTKPENAEGYIDGSIQNHGFSFTKEIIDTFSDNWQFEGGISTEKTVENLKYIYDNVKGSPRFILILGSEIDYEGDNKEFANLVPRHKALNAAMAEFAREHSNVRLINATDYIKSQSDYIDCINHYARNVYYDMAADIVAYINEKVEEMQNTAQTASNVDSLPYDTLIMTTVADYERLERLYPRMLSTIPAKAICFVGSKEVGDLVESSGLGPRLGFVNENDILTFDEVHAVMTDALKDILDGRELPRGVTGWYYQQFLKMAYSRICQDEYYLVWDGDTVPCSKFSMFKEGTVTPYFDLKTECHEEYFVTLSKLIPGMGKVIKKSFISEHMLIKTEFMKELIAVIESNNGLKGNTFYEKIIYVIEPEKLLSNSFSEFETYGTYVALRHMSAYMLRDWHSFRYGGAFFDMNTISESDFEWLSHDFNAITFEKGHEVREDHKNLFDNKEYQSKLTARQMLEIAQEEFKGDSFIESWE